ncbi:MAG: hypothetical protein M1569_02935 [Candidatus Marsarchaeota archaeon]|nr:hypothetical protein [Candidatus Marsarchaeota archaeon]
MSFYGIVIIFTILLCAILLSAIYAEAAPLNHMNLQYAGISHFLRIMSGRIST